MQESASTTGKQKRKFQIQNKCMTLNITLKFLFLCTTKKSRYFYMLSCYDVKILTILFVREGPTFVLWSAQDKIHCTWDITDATCRICLCFCLLLLNFVVSIYYLEFVIKLSLKDTVSLKSIKAMFILQKKEKYMTLAVNIFIVICL